MNKKLKILMSHNYYRQPGGEDRVFATEVAMLREKGHSVIEYTDHNDRIKTINPLVVFRNTLWSSYTCKRFVKLIREEKPDIAHFHNTFPLISPSAYYACKKMNVPVVQTLHNYRLLCPGANFFRSGTFCEKCLYKTPPWPGIFYACYHKSVIHTFVVAIMLTCHRLSGTWKNKVNTYISLTEFARKKFIQGGLPADKIIVKPNFIYPDPGERKNDGNYTIFVGRLSPEKGIRTLIKAWELIKHIPLKIVGDGPLMNELITKVNEKGLKNVEILGKKEKNEVIVLIKNSRFLICPSECYETFGLTAIEAFACGIPVIASKLGALEELIVENHTGFYFNPGNAHSLAETVDSAWRQGNEIKQMGKEARKVFEQKYNAESNYRKLIEIYNITVGNR